MKKNKILLMVFFALLAFLFLTKLFDKSNTKHSFDPNILEIDSNQISSIIIQPRGKNEVIKIYKESENWKLSKGELKVDCDENVLKSMLNGILELKAHRVASRKKSNWEKFELTDSLSTNVKLFENEKLLVDFRIGKFSFNQQAGSAIAYLRFSDEEICYAIDGFLAYAFLQDFNMYRDKTLLKLNKNNLTKIDFTYPDSSYILEKINQNWNIENLNLDSSLVENYLNQLCNLNNSNFEDEFKPNKTLFQINIEGQNMNPESIKCFAGLDSNQYIVATSQFPNKFIKSGKQGLFQQIFKGKSAFQSVEEN